jgi:transketolase
LSAVPRIEGCLTTKLQTAGWAKYSHEQYGLQSWGASGPYKKVYEKFGITGDSTFPFRIYGRLPEFHHFTDIAVVGKKVVDFYAAKGGEVVSPLVKAF